MAQSAWASQSFCRLPNPSLKVGIVVSDARLLGASHAKIGFHGYEETSSLVETNF